MVDIFQIPPSHELLKPLALQRPWQIAGPLELHEQRPPARNEEDPVGPAGVETEVELK
jgi:hypothetical protein